MNELLKNRCDLLVKNRKSILNAFHLESTHLALAGSIYYTSLNLEVDINRLEKVERILKKNTSMLSIYREYMKIPLLIQMDLSDEPELYLNLVMENYEKIKAHKLFGSEYKLLASMLLTTSHFQDGNFDNIIENTQSIYQEMKKNHHFLTGEEDYPFALMLADTNRNQDDLITDMEDSFTLLKKYFKDSNALQSLTHVLALDSRNVLSKRERVIDLYQGLKNAKHKYPNGYELCVLGPIAMMDVNLDLIIQQICEADDYLEKHYGFGNLMLGSSLRRMYSAIIVSSLYYENQLGVVESLLTSSLSIAIATQTATMAAVSASTAASVTC